MRITKDKEVRRAELVDAAATLFVEKGYADTMVSDIVRRVGVAQGTFYYYFPTKENVLDSVVEVLLKETVQRAQWLAGDASQSCLQRLENLFRMLFSPRASLEANSRYSDLLQDRIVHAHMQEARLRLLSPVFRALLDDGVAAGEFNPLRYSDELSEMALRGAAAFLNGRREAMVEPMIANNTMDALAELMEKLLGLAEGSLDFKDRVIRRHL